MRKFSTVLMASLLPLAVIAVVGNVKMLRDVFIPAQPRFGGGE